METVAAASRSVASADAVLIASAARGDVAAFESLIATRLDRCYRLAWSIVGNEADAADAVQEAVIAAWKTLPRLRDTGAFDGWLNRIVANAARMSRRHRTRLREIAIAPTPDDPVDAVMDQPAAHDRSESDVIVDRDTLRRAFERLKPDQRAILALHHVDGRPVAEIARALGIPTGTVKWRLHAARKALAQAMGVEA